MFPVLAEDWTSEEEVLLLDGIEQHGYGNWLGYSIILGLFSSTLGFHHHNPGVWPEVIQMLQMALYFNSLQICEQGLLKPLGCILEVPLLQSG